MLAKIRLISLLLAPHFALNASGLWRIWGGLAVLNCSAILKSTKHEVQQSALLPLLLGAVLGTATVQSAQAMPTGGSVSQGVATISVLDAQTQHRSNKAHLQQLSIGIVLIFRPDTLSDFNNHHHRQRYSIA